MKRALYDPTSGYYQRSDRERWGSAGDYRTSPERSTLFAATFTRYFARLYEELGRPREWTIVECGAGGGDFSLGVLEALARRFPEVFDATRYIVYDVSLDALRRTRERLVEFGDRVMFVSSFDEIRIDNGIFFSNELLDAFPVHRVVMNDEELSEFYVAVDASGEFVWTTGPLSTPRLVEFIDEYAIELTPGQVIEINFGIESWLSAVSEKFEKGFLITVDYGAESTELYDPTLRPDGTLRGFSGHGFVDNLLAGPGEYDLTTTINWTQVKNVSEKQGWKVIEFAMQDKFLLNAGLPEQLQYRLSRAQTGAERVSLTTGARDMILPGGMASSFQVLVQKRS